MTSLDDLSRAVRTAYVHTRPGGVALFVPDGTRESFAPYADHGGHDGPDGRALRYLEWTIAPDPGETFYEVHFACLLREATTCGSCTIATGTRCSRGSSGWTCSTPPGSC